MITHPLPHLEAPSSRSLSEDALRLLREQPQRPQASEARQARAIPAPGSTLALFQLLLGYEWLLAGADKLLLGTFPAQLSGLLQTSLTGGHLPGFFAALLRGLVVPHATLFGFFIEWAELLAGSGLISAGLFTLLAPLVLRLRTGLVVKLFIATQALLEKLAPLAAGGAGMLGLSFFLLDGMPAPWFTPNITYGGSIDTGLFLAASSLILLVSQFTPLHRSR